MKRLAIITTHPIQYNAPFFKMLAQRNNIEIKVYYTWGQSQQGVKYDPGFGKNIEWDIPLLDEYNYNFCKNVAKKPGSNHFFGIKNPDLLNELTNWQPNVILVYGWAFLSHLKVILHFYKKVPVYFRGDSTLIDEVNGIKSKIKNIVLKYIYSKIDIAFYVGEQNKKYFEKFSVAQSKLKFMPHAIDNDRFSPSESNTNQALTLKQKLGIKNTDFVFVFAGKFEAKKNPLILLEAFINVYNTTHHLVMVGNGDLESIIKKKYAPYSNIHFIDFQNQSTMPAIYAMCNVFVLPSFGPNETWGLAINEAMAAGKAIIASNACGATSNLVLHKVNGLVFEKNNLEQLVEALEYCISHQEEVKQMGIKSKEIIADYSFTQNCKILEQTLLNES